MSRSKTKPSRAAKPTQRAAESKASAARRPKQVAVPRGKAHRAPSRSPKRTAKPAARAHTDLRALAAEIELRLSRAMPEPRCELDHRDAWQLLIATILSAQSTDRMVNRITPKLFEAYPTPVALAAADPVHIEELIKASGFFRNKTKSILGASKIIAEQHGGNVPRSLEALIELPGVARKTANVVLGTAYRIASGITVDTHAGRVARRLTLSKHEDPIRVEQDLRGLFAESSWIDMGHRFVLHGRYVCLARKPRCTACPLSEVCRSTETAAPSGSWRERAAAEREIVDARGAVPSAD